MEVLQASLVRRFSLIFDQADKKEVLETNSKFLSH